MEMSIYFAPKTILNKISYSFSMTSRFIKSDGQSILLAVIIIIFLGVINLQDYEYSCYIESPSQISKKISMLFLNKNTVVQNLISQNSEQDERTELLRSQIETALFSQGDGHTYTQFPLEYMEQFRQLEKFAPDNQKGLWENTQTNVTTIHVAPGKYSPFYHIRFSLTPDNTVLSIPLSERKPKYSDNNDYIFAEGGQFEVFIERGKFLIPSPHSERQYLILRMPWTRPDIENADQYIAEKYELFKKIGGLKDNPNSSVEVTIELNPFINVLSEEPLELELSGRNIFFRQAHGRYIDYVGELKTP